MNGMGREALKDTPIPNLHKMFEHQARGYLGHVPLENGSQLLLMNDATLRNFIAKFADWGINDNRTARRCMVCNTDPERIFPNGMHSGNNYSKYDLALMFTNLFGLKDDLKKHQEREAAKKAAADARAEGLEDSQRPSKRAKTEDTS